jgi:catechol 2,3-dioxygenase-like lactoylglutathione lyase family enzyme
MRIVLSSIYVNDQNAARRFYTETLGFQVKQDFPVGAFQWLTVVSPSDPDGVELVLEPNDNPIAATYQRELFEAGIPVTILGVDDLQSEYERLSAAGVTFAMTPTPMGPVMSAVFDDTCGNLINVSQRVG